MKTPSTENISFTIILEVNSNFTDKEEFELVWKRWWSQTIPPAVLGLNSTLVAFSLEQADKKQLNRFKQSEATWETLWMPSSYILYNVSRSDFITCPWQDQITSHFLDLLIMVLSTFFGILIENSWKVWWGAAVLDYRNFNWTVSTNLGIFGQDRDHYQEKQQA